MVLASAAALSALSMPMQLTGQVTADPETEGSSATPDGTQDYEIVAAFSPPSALDECNAELAECTETAEGLRTVVLEKCERPSRDFEAAAWENANFHKYIEGEFDCNDYSRTLTEELKALGYNVRIVEGYYKDEPHAWVIAEIPIEATSGNLITPKQYSDYVEEK